MLEACVETFEQARKAEQNGANRIELCSNLEVGGLTPSVELIEKTCSELQIPVMVMIRPRAGDFIYNEQEIKQMRTEIASAKKLGASGLVFGALTSENKIDKIAIEHLTKAAYPLPVTFHKAIDVMDNPVDGISELLEIDGITRVLTSGGKPTAFEGVKKLKEMISVSKGEITIIAAGKVTDLNRDEIAVLTGAAELHGKRIVGDLS